MYEQLNPCLAQQYKYTYQQAMPVEQLVRRLADNKQYYTMHGGMRPYGVSVLYAGWDKHLGFQLYLVRLHLTFTIEQEYFKCNTFH